jgi:hypothetical protein
MKVKQACDELIGARKYPVSAFFGEIGEALWALLKLDFKELLEELEQLMFLVQVIYHQRTGADFEIRYCKNVLAEAYQRRRVWTEMFALLEIPFSNKYLENGSNYRKPHKIRAAFQMAGLRINVIHSVLLCEKFTKRYP